MGGQGQHYAKTYLRFKSPTNELNIFTLRIGTPYLLTILVLKFEIIHSPVLAGGRLLLPVFRA